MTLPRLRLIEANTKPYCFLHERPTKDHELQRRQPSIIVMDEHTDELPVLNIKAIPENTKSSPHGAERIVKYELRV